MPTRLFQTNSERIRERVMLLDVQDAGVAVENISQMYNVIRKAVSQDVQSDKSRKSTQSNGEAASFKDSCFANRGG